MPAFEVPSRISSSNTGESSQRKRNPFTLTASADVHHSPYSLQEHNSENFKVKRTFLIRNFMVHSFVNFNIGTRISY